MEKRVAIDSATVIVAEHDGIVTNVDSNSIEITPTQADPFNLVDKKDIYFLRKFERTNQNTCINQRPIIKLGDKIKAGQIIADGCATKNGELSLGKNILIAFMPWRGYNYEDAIIASERLVRDDVFTSVHIEQFELQVRDTKAGPEELTADIPNVSEDMLKNLSEKGIVRIGAEVESGDILVGKVAPRGESDYTPEERLLRAIFGEKAGDVKDSSLRVPPGMKGIVIGSVVLSRKEHNEQQRRLEKEKIESLKKEAEEFKQNINKRCRKKLISLLNGCRVNKMLSEETREAVFNPGEILTKNMLNKLDYESISVDYDWVEDKEISKKIRELFKDANALIEGKEEQTHENFDKFPRVFLFLLSLL